VMGFLFGMFSIVSALEMSGVLRLVALKMLSKTNSHPDLILMVFVVGMGLLSAFLVNDTIAVMAIPIIAHISWQIGIRPQVFLIALSFGITIGSTMTPIGNPQNLLIALQSGIPLPFLTFVKVLGIPTVVNLFATFFILKTYFKRDLALSPALLPNQHSRKQEQHQQQLQKRRNSHPPKRNNQKIRHSYFYKHEPISFPRHHKAESAAAAEQDDDDDDDDDAIVNPLLAKISIAVLLLTISGFVLSETVQFVFHFSVNFSLGIIAMLGATTLYALSKERKEILSSVNYPVLVFFASMFVFTSALWSSGIISQMVSYFPTPDKHDLFQSNAVISVISIALSQVLSNVPFVVFYSHIMISNGFAGAPVGSDGGHVNQWMMLAAASTIAGNLTILAAASNIIILEAAESKGLKAFSFFEFFKIGAIVTAVNIAVYYLFIVLVFA
jgi:Na+/H+ antiporter NhaD/arsenite permease-like protein